MSLIIDGKVKILKCVLKRVLSSKVDTFNADDLIEFGLFGSRSNVNYNRYTGKLPYCKTDKRSFLYKKEAVIDFINDKIDCLKNNYKDGNHEVEAGNAAINNDDSDKVFMESLKDYIDQCVARSIKKHDN